MVRKYIVCNMYEGQWIVQYLKYFPSKVRTKYSPLQFIYQSVLLKIKHKQIFQY